MTFLFKNGTSDKRGVAKVASTTLRLCLEKPVLENYGMAVKKLQRLKSASSRNMGSDRTLILPALWDLTSNAL